MKEEYQKLTLENGVRLILVPDESKNVVTSFVLFRVGSRYEAESIAGISHVLEHMHYKGTEKRPTSLLVSEFIEDIGGEHNAFTSKEYTGYYAKTAANYLPKALDFLSDILNDPLFDEKELEQEKQVILQEVDMYEDLPMEVAASNFEKTLLGDNALGRDVIGTKESILAVTRDDLLSFKKRYYTGRNTVIVLSGNFGGLNNRAVADLVSKYFRFKNTAASPHQPVELPRKKGYRIVKRKTEQSHLLIGFRGASYTDPDRYKLKMLALVLGGSMSSRMFTEIREKRGLAYAVRSSSSSYLDSGTIETYAGVPHSRVLEAVEAILDEYRKIKRSISEAELARAKEIIHGRLLIGMEDTNEVANHFALSLMLGGKVMTPAEVDKIYASITVPELEIAADKYLTDKNMALSFVGRDLTATKLEKIFKL